MDTDDNIKVLGASNTGLHIDADLSNSDCSTSSKQDLARLAMQASQLQCIYLAGTVEVWETYV